MIEEIKSKSPHLKINYAWDIFVNNDIAIREDFELLTRKHKSQKLSETNRAFNEENIFIEKGAKIECAVLNA